MPGPTLSGDGGSGLPPESFCREDETDDALFYRQPRLVTHIDDEAIGALTAFYRQVIPDGARVLDLMTSWVSHLPAGKPLSGVSGVGLNAVELAANPALTERVVQDLNRDPVLPWPNGCFDAAVVTVSVQYLTRPVEVFAEAGRVLRPGAPFVVAFSHRCFPSKAIAAWLERGPRGHAELVTEYFRLARAFASARSFNISPGRGHDPMYVVMAQKLAG